MHTSARLWLSCSSSTSVLSAPPGVRRPISTHEIRWPNGVACTAGPQSSHRCIPTCTPAPVSLFRGDRRPARSGPHCCSLSWPARSDSAWCSTGSFVRSAQLVAAAAAQSEALSDARHWMLSRDSELPKPGGCPRCPPPPSWVSRPSVVLQLWYTLVAGHVLFSGHGSVNPD